MRSGVNAGRRLLTACVATAAVLLLFGVSPVVCIRRVSTWMCLENCGESIAASEQLLAVHGPPRVGVHSPGIMSEHEQREEVIHHLYDDAGNRNPLPPPPEEHSHTHLGTRFGDDPANGHAHNHGTAPASSTHHTHSELDTVTAVIYVAYSVSHTGQLQWMNYSDVGKRVKSYGVSSIAMINEVNLTSLRTLFRDPNPFIASALSVARSRSHDGFNIAFEPTLWRPKLTAAPPRVTEADGEAFLRFLVAFTEAAHAAGLTVSVNIASTQPLWWNIPALLHTDVDKLITMDTYQSDFDHWKTAFYTAVNTIPLYRLGIGLLTERVSWSTEDWHARFGLMETFDISGELEVCIWRLATIDPVGWDTLFHYMHDDVAQSAKRHRKQQKPYLTARKSAAGASAGAGADAASSTSSEVEAMPADWYDQSLTPTDEDLVDLSDHTEHASAHELEQHSAHEREMSRAHARAHEEL